MWKVTIDDIRTVLEPHGITEENKLWEAYQIVSQENCVVEEGDDRNLDEQLHIFYSKIENVLVRREFLAGSKKWS